MREASDATEAMINILRELAQYDDDFFRKLAAKVRGRTRNHIARSRSEVYPRRPDLARYVKEVVPGWFIGGNIANREKKRILVAACDVMGLIFDRDIKIDLEERAAWGKAEFDRKRKIVLNEYEDSTQGPNFF